MWRYKIQAQLTNLRSGFFSFFFFHFLLKKKKRNWKRTFRRSKVHSVQSDLQYLFLSFRPTFGLPFSITNSFLFQISQSLWEIFQTVANPILAVTTGGFVCEFNIGSTSMFPVICRNCSHYAKQAVHTKSIRLWTSEENFHKELSRITSYRLYYIP